MISFEAFTEELLKIAADVDDYKKVRIGKDHAYLRRGIPLVGKLPKNPDKAVAKLQQVINSEEAQQSVVLGYKNIAVRAKDMPDLRSAGFRATRIATPLPGEKVFQKSYRKGTMHAHRQGPFYLVHEDVHTPLHPKWGYFHKKGIKHAWEEGLPSVIERYRETHKPLVKRRLEDD